MTFSEFGRRPEANDGGTDHGTVGDRCSSSVRTVKGGLYGAAAVARELGPRPVREPQVPTSTFAASTRPSSTSGSAPTTTRSSGKTYPNLDLFRAGPGTGDADRATPEVVGQRLLGRDRRPARSRAWATRRRRPRLRALARPVVGGDSTRTQRGFWLVASDGGIFSLRRRRVPRLHRRHPPQPADRRHGRDPRRHAATGSSPPTAASSASATPRFHGSTGAMHLNQPIVGMAATPSGQAATGSSPPTAASSASATPSFHGSTGAIHLNRADRRHGRDAERASGYWLVASDGGIFCFGDAGFHGSAGGGGCRRRRATLRRTASGKRLLDPRRPTGPCARTATRPTTAARACAPAVALLPADFT